MAEHAEHPEHPGHEGEGHEQHEGEGHGHGGGHGKGHGGGHADGHGGGGHGGSWLVTYCDMITLLMAMFICIITFSSREPERYSKKRDSLMYGEGGTGIAGNLARGLEHDSFLWRKRPLSARSGLAGSEIPPRYSDPAERSTAQVLRELDEKPLGTLADSYGLRVPLAMLFTADGKLTASARQLLQAVTRNLKNLPYDILFELNDPATLAKGVALAEYVATTFGLPPSRMAVGMHPTTDAVGPSVWIVFSRRS